MGLWESETEKTGKTAVRFLTRVPDIFRPFGTVGDDIYTYTEEWITSVSSILDYWEVGMESEVAS